MTPRYLRALREAVAQEGMTVIEITGNGHPKVRVALGAKSRIWVVAGTPSEHRGWKNSIAVLRRLKREMEQDPAR